MEFCFAVFLGSMKAFNVKYNPSRYKYRGAVVDTLIGEVQKLCLINENRNKRFIQVIDINRKQIF